MNCTVRRRFTARAARVGDMRIPVVMAIFMNYECCYAEEGKVCGARSEVWDLCNVS